MSNVNDYLVAANEVVEETIVTRSRFICYLYPCTSTVAAKEFVNKLKQQHPQANHHCYAFMAGRSENSQLYGFSDDGEPSGTAGKPMLTMLIGSGIGELCAVVVRYFGGTKLGTGGLQRAYGLSVKQALLKLNTKVKKAMVYKALTCEYTQVNDVLYFLDQSHGKVITQDYRQTIELTIELPFQAEKRFAQQLQTLSAGKLQLKAIKEQYVN